MPLGCNLLARVPPRKFIPRTTETRAGILFHHIYTTKYFTTRTVQYAALPDHTTYLTTASHPVPQKNLLPRPPGGRDVTVVGSCVSNKIALLVLRRGQTRRLALARRPAPGMQPCRCVLFLAPSMSRHTIHSPSPWPTANPAIGTPDQSRRRPRRRSCLYQPVDGSFKVAPGGIAIPNEVETTRRGNKRCGVRV